jgi:hypothetical protein
LVGPKSKPGFFPAFAFKKEKGTIKILSGWYRLEQLLFTPMRIRIKLPVDKFLELSLFCHFKIGKDFWTAIEPVCGRKCSVSSVKEWFYEKR